MTVSKHRQAPIPGSRDELGRIRKGFSGNPDGRSPPEREVLALAKSKGVRAIERLAEWMESADAVASVAACKAMLDRGFGKPTQRMEITDPETMSDEQLKRAAEEVAREVLGVNLEGMQ